MDLKSLEDFLEAIQVKKLYPEGLELSLYRKYDLLAEGAKAIATALQSGHCPQGLQISLWETQIRNEGAEAFAIALQSGNCPRGLQLALEVNQIGDDGVKAIATALQSGQCPQGLKLSLSDNQIGDKGAKAIATALQSGNCPQGLKLSLAYNCISGKGLIDIATALQSGQCPQGLQLDLCGNGIGKRSKKALKKAWQIYHSQQQDNFLKCAALQHGHQQGSSPLSQLPQEILEKIYRYILPTTPISAKMTEISAKVFREKYTSVSVSDTFVQGLAEALSAKIFTEKAEKIKNTTEHFLQKELGALEKEKFVHSPTIALLCKYHLIASKKVIEDPNHRDHFQLRESQSTKLTQ